MPGEQPAVSVVVPARDATQTLGRTLDALRAQRLDAGFEVVVVDDGSRDATAALAERYGPLVTVLCNPSSRGPGAARNLGVSVASAPVIAFTDADCFPAADWLANGLAGLERADVVQGAVVPDPSVTRTPFDRTVVVDRDRGLYQTANLFVRRDVFERAGGFRDWVLEREATRRRPRRWAEDGRRGRVARTPIGEDTAFAWAARRAGARVAFAADAVVHHEIVPGTLRDEIEDRWHWARDMPGVVRQVPELRGAGLYRRWFFHSRTANFDLALASVAVAALTRSVLPLAGTAGYARWVRREALSGQGPDPVRAAAGMIAADTVTFLGLIVGSATWRAVVL